MTAFLVAAAALAAPQHPDGPRARHHGLREGSRPRVDGAGKEINGKEIKYILSGPSDATSAAIFLHGAAGNRKMLRHHCDGLALLSAKAFACDLTSLVAGGSFREVWIDRSVRSAQERNVRQVVAHAEWLNARHLALVGHSAGGAVALEAAVALQAAGRPPAVVVLLDAVPWQGTIEACSELDLRQTRVVSLRCRPSVWNRKGAPLEQALRRIPPRGEGRLLDLRLPRARHGDAMPPSCAGRLLGLVGSGFEGMNSLWCAFSTAP